MGQVEQRRYAGIGVVIVLLRCKRGEVIQLVGCGSHFIHEGGHNLGWDGPMTGALHKEIDIAVKCLLMGCD